MLKSKIYPDILTNYLYTFIICELNKLESESSVFERLIMYARELVVSVKGEIIFIRVWKQKVKNDKGFEMKKLEGFCDHEWEGKEMFKKFISL